jgi:hypothetical protein
MAAFPVFFMTQNEKIEGGLLSGGADRRLG